MEKKTKKKVSKKVKKAEAVDAVAGNGVDERVARLRLGVDTVAEFYLGDMENVRLRKRLIKIAASLESVAVSLQSAIDVRDRAKAKADAQAERYAKKAKALGYNQFDRVGQEADGSDMD